MWDNLLGKDFEGGNNELRRRIIKVTQRMER